MMWLSEEGLQVDRRYHGLCARISLRPSDRMLLRLVPLDYLHGKG